ncbi:MAG: glycosyltransferase family 2 protein [Chitinophagales bacterium]|nr:glycosyltransferase family 2 protein [Chitinophagales bacterium]MDW8393292.1 glycosyltransferase family 2 protein [Chitinophagales bacterium]
MIYRLELALLLFLYGTAALFLLGYSLAQLHLVFIYLKKRKKSTSGFAAVRSALPEPLPYVTVQLPVYNELYVIQRLLDAVSRLNYPRDRLEIQILDDSTDETTSLIEHMLPELKDRGLQVVHLRRQHRSGFKAGALAYGLEQARGSFIAILDADFVPHPDFLLRALSHFSDPQVGVVQGRWGHINRDYSLLTELQAMALDAHFTVEQAGRNSAGFFINFNGTAGVWRKSCIVSSGGWATDTLTEDLDLSYRAQRLGWRFVYVEDLVVPAELPVTLEAVRSQQFRWNKGAAECARKHLVSVLKDRLPLTVRIHAFFHLLNSTAFLAILLMALLSVPVAMLKRYHPDHPLWMVLAVLSLWSLVNFGLFFWTSYKAHHERETSLLHFVKRYLLLLTVYLGLSLQNALAVLEGLLGRSTAFVRTPKFNVRRKGEEWRHNRYVTHRLGGSVVAEGLLGLFFAAAVLISVWRQEWMMVAFHLLLAIGFIWVFVVSLVHARRRLEVRVAQA